MLTFNKWQQIFCQKPTAIEQLTDFMDVNIIIKRDDLNHKIIQGNKLRKLKYNLRFAQENGYKQLATFGGAWSNHLLATAQAANLMDFASIGFVRGDELEDNSEKWSNTLKHVQQDGMQLIFLTREEYRKKQHSQTVQDNVAKDCYLIAEGGSNHLALQGVAEIIDELQSQIEPPTHIITACGTAGTLAGLIEGVAKTGWQTKVLGIPVLKGAEFLNVEVKKLTQKHNKVDWQLYLDYHAGGYAKLDAKTKRFAKEFSLETNIPLDKIYTAKSFFATYDLIRKGIIPAKSHVLILHTGGLQGGIV